MPPYVFTFGHYLVNLEQVTYVDIAPRGVTFWFSSHTLTIDADDDPKAYAAVVKWLQSWSITA